MSELACRTCGKLFTPWRGKIYCSEACRKRAENWRLRGDKSRSGTMIPDAQNIKKKDEQNQAPAEAVRGDEGQADKARAATWIACNEITDKFDHRGAAIGWTMKVEGLGWFGRVGKEMAFGPTTRERARLSVEAYLKGEPFSKKKNVRGAAIVGLSSQHG
jgi:hypothetical protein